MTERAIKVRAAITLLLLISILAFTAQNTALIEIHLFRWSFEIRRSLLTFSMLAIGFFIGWSWRAICRVMLGTNKRS